MKIGFCMLLWTTHVTDAHRAIIEDIKATGYDGIEIPVFEGSPDHYAKLGRMLDEIGLERTAITRHPEPRQEPARRRRRSGKAAVDYLRYCTDCAAALGAPQLAGPMHQTLGHFSGAGPTEAERERAREVHRKAGDYAAAQNVRLVLEAINRFECYFANTMDDLSRLSRLARRTRPSPACTTRSTPISRSWTRWRRSRGTCAQHRLRAHLGERPRRAGARARALGGDVLGDQAVRL